MADLGLPHWAALALGAILIVTTAYLLIKHYPGHARLLVVVAIGFGLVAVGTGSGVNLSYGGDSGLKLEVEKLQQQVAEAEARNQVLASSIGDLTGAIQLVYAGTGNARETEPFAATVDARRWMAVQDKLVANGILSRDQLPKPFVWSEGTQQLPGLFVPMQLEKVTKGDDDENKRQ